MWILNPDLEYRSYSNFIIKTQSKLNLNHSVDLESNFRMNLLIKF